MKDTNDVLKITKLAEAGDVAAMIDLARRYEGGLGVDKDVDTAFWWWKKPPTPAARTHSTKFPSGTPTEFIACPTTRNRFFTANARQCKVMKKP